MTDDPIVEAYRLLVADVYELAGRSRETSERYARERGQSAARWHVLSVVSEEPHTVPEIADRLGLTRQSVQRVVDDLADTGAVELIDNPRHRRSRLVRLTPTGAATVDALFAASEESRRRQLDAAGVSVAELRRARRTIRRLLDALDEISE